jgi:hypothetical protein
MLSKRASATIKLTGRMLDREKDRTVLKWKLSYTCTGRGGIHPRGEHELATSDRVAAPHRRSALADLGGHPLPSRMSLRGNQNRGCPLSLWIKIVQLQVGSSPCVGESLPPRRDPRTRPISIPSAADPHARQIPPRGRFSHTRVHRVTNTSYLSFPDRERRRKISPQ